MDSGVSALYMMYKCIMGKVGGNEKHVKHAKTDKFYKIRGEFFKTGGK